MGKIILLNTPIGNLGDITERVRGALQSGVLFAVEDTRVFRELLHHLGISASGKKIFSLHDQSESNQVDKLISKAEQEDLYVASEAGSPIISDPAYPLVVAAYEKGLRVESLSGVSSPVMALELSGLPPIPFHFHGFLPRESGKRIKYFTHSSYGTHIFFEAPTRVEETLNELCSTRPESVIVVVRELSKKFEQVLRFKGKDWARVKKELIQKGEFVILYHNSEERGESLAELKELAQEILANQASSKQVAKLIGKILDRPTKEIYSELNRQKQDT